MPELAANGIVPWYRKPKPEFAAMNKPPVVQFPTPNSVAGMLPAAVPAWTVSHDRSARETERIVEMSAQAAIELEAL